MLHLRIALLLAACALVGCTKAILGDWKQKDRGSCGESEMEIEEGSYELEGRGTLRVSVAGNCNTCAFEMSGDHDEGDDYNFSLSFQGCACDGLGRGDATCEVSSSKDELDCNFTLGSCLNASQDFERD